MSKFIQIVVGLFLIMTTSGIAFGGELAVFHSKLDAAYAPYRASLSLTNKKNKEKEALQKMNSSLKKWVALNKAYLNNPPAPYNDSPLWRSTLPKMEAIMKKGIQQVEAGRVKEGHETIEKIRSLLGKLRKSVNIHTFSDYLNTYHTEMEHLVSVKYSKQTLTGDKLIKVREKLAVIRFLMGEVKANSPQKYAGNREFTKALNGNVKLLKLLHNSINNGEINKVLALLKKVKPAYGKLFIKFG